MTNEQKKQLLLDLIKIEENGEIFNFTRAERAEFQMWVDGLIDKQKVLDKIKAEIREWYWQADKQELAKDPCVVDAMIDLFIRTIDKYKAESEDKEC
jgi:hypothetical protein